MRLIKSCMEECAPSIKGEGHMIVKSSLPSMAILNESMELAAIVPWSKRKKPRAVDYLEPAGGGHLHDLEARAMLKRALECDVGAQPK